MKIDQKQGINFGEGKVPIKILLIVVNLDEATHILGFTVKFLITIRHQYQQKEKSIDDISKQNLAKQGVNFDEWLCITPKLTFVFCCFFQVLCH